MHAALNTTQAAAGHLVIKDLTKRYEGHDAVAGINLDIRPGELVALLGPSGCGKTTLLRCIAGLVQPSAGDIVIDGRSIVGKPVHLRDLGMVFQSYALFPHMTVRDNVGFGLRMRGLGRAEIARRVADALTQVRMERLSDRMPSELSGGQQQRVALARAIVTNPNVLLLDEPFSALDAKLREAMQIEVRELQKRLNITTIFVTHDQEEALTTADRVAVVNNGTIEQFDSPRASYSRPRTLFVADFIGSMNQLRGSLVAREGEVARICLEGSEQPFHAVDSPGIAAGVDLVGVIRPERIDIGADGQCAKGRNALSGTIQDVIFIGEKLEIRVATACGPITACVQNSSHGAVGAIAAGANVTLNWETSDMLIFPAH